VCNAKQFVDTLRTDKQTAVVIGENDIASFDHEVAEARGAQRRGITRLEASGTGRAHSITENRQTNLSELRRIAMRAPDYNSS
jgi:hypothetical protein